MLGIFANDLKIGISKFARFPDSHATSDTKSDEGTAIGTREETNMLIQKLLQYNPGCSNVSFICSQAHCSFGVKININQTGSVKFIFRF